MLPAQPPIRAASPDLERHRQRALLGEDVPREAIGNTMMVS
jgi:hypothetical protein